MKHSLSALFFLLLAAGTEAKTYFVATDGSDSNTGTIESPFATLGKAYSLDDADSIFFRAGTYVITEDQIMQKSGIYANVFEMSRKAGEQQHLFIGGYMDERPVFDLSEVRPEGMRVCVFHVTGDYHHFRNFEVVGTQVTVRGHTQSECFRNDGGNHNIYENIAMHDGMAIGFYLTGGAYNLVLNCDAYMNYDNFSEGPKGGNVDGFGGHPRDPESVGNIFRGCRAWWNSDDGFDLINANAPVTIESCWSFYNGYRPGTMDSAGDGSGFKSGGYGMSAHPRNPEEIPMHVIANCIAYYNKNRGFYANHHLGGIIFACNSAYMNPSNFCLLNRKSPEEAVDVPGYGHIVASNLSFMPRNAGEDIIDVDSSRCVIANNSFMPDVEMSAEDFASLCPEQLMQPRQKDGSLPDINFLKPLPETELFKREIGRP